VVRAWKAPIKDKIEIFVGMLWKRVHPSRCTYIRSTRAFYVRDGM
jgi:hypothetical protein